jgi:nucleoid-associated protein YgaU
MTSDAKIGLLLGLVFIFIIAFMINGLPSFRKDANNNELTTSMVSSQNNPPAFGAKEREVINRRKQVEGRPLKVQSRPRDNQDVRFKTVLPKSTSVVKVTGGVESVTPAQPLPAVEKKEIREVKLSGPTLPKVYVVNKGDNLTVIAERFYGSQDGSKRVNIARIFEANAELLKSPDEICEGQRLFIPSLAASVPGESKVSGVLASSMLEKIKSIGTGLSAGGSGAKRSRQYVVREGDSLWRIAAEQFGNGNRYSEIAELNADILDDEDSLIVGMRLRLPGR